MREAANPPPKVIHRRYAAEVHEEAMCLLQAIEIRLREIKRAEHNLSKLADTDPRRFSYETALQIVRKETALMEQRLAILPTFTFCRNDAGELMRCDEKGQPFEPEF